MGHFLAGISATTVKNRISQPEIENLISRTGCAPRERGLICFIFLHIALLDKKIINKDRTSEEPLLFISDIYDIITSPETNRPVIYIKITT